MKSTRLFERLVNINGDHTSKQALLASIESHVQLLLKVRQGASLTCPTLGLPELNVQYMTPFDANREICTQMANMLAIYEPRISDIIVTRIDSLSSLMMNFSISCNVNYQGEIVFFQFSTSINNRS